MKRLALLLVLLLPSGSLAATRVLLLEDIGSAEARFAWNKGHGDRVVFSATVDHPLCWDQYCYDYHSTGALPGFERRRRDVYYVGPEGGRSILCGRTHGLLGSARFDDRCRVSVEPELVCVAWYGEGDCVEAVTRYRVYLDIEP